MSVALFPPLLLEIGDFVIWVKARNAFLTQGFLPSDATKVVNKIDNQVMHITFFSERQEKTMRALRDIRFSKDKVNTCSVYEDDGEDENF